jgi:hypothetical protein
MEGREAYRLFRNNSFSASGCMFFIWYLFLKGSGDSNRVQLNQGSVSRVRLQNLILNLLGALMNSYILKKNFLEGSGAGAWLPMQDGKQPAMPTENHID